MHDVRKSHTEHNSILSSSNRNKAALFSNVKCAHTVKKHKNKINMKLRIDYSGAGEDTLTSRACSWGQKAGQTMQEACRGTRDGGSDEMEPEFCIPVPTAPSPTHCLPAPTAPQHQTAPSCFLILPATEVGPAVVTDIIPVKGLMHTFKHTRVIIT